MLVYDLIILPHDELLVSLFRCFLALICIWTCSRRVRFFPRHRCGVVVVEKVFCECRPCGIVARKCWRMTFYPGFKWSTCFTNVGYWATRLHSKNTPLLDRGGGPNLSILIELSEINFLRIDASFAKVEGERSSETKRWMKELKASSLWGKGQKETQGWGYPW